MGRNDAVEKLTREDYMFAVKAGGYIWQYLNVVVHPVTYVPILINPDSIA